MTRRVARRVALGWLAAVPLAACGRGAAVAVGSKDFTEALIIGELYAQTLERAGLRVERRLSLGGSNIALAALRRGGIDLYPEYTGTGLVDILHLPTDGDEARAFATVRREYARRYDLRWLARTPMSDTQAIATTQAIAKQFGLRTLSDLAARAPELRIGAVPEFVKRADGLPGLQKTYGGFQFKAVRLVDFGLKYAALRHGDVDVVVAFSTDGAIVADQLVLLTDDKYLFPADNCAPVARPAALARHPQIAPALDALSAKITTEAMRALNLQVDGPDKREPEDVARDFLTRVHRG
jgi:osmoprotectant transport system substrate-binding protein